MDSSRIWKFSALVMVNIIATVWCLDHDSRLTHSLRPSPRIIVPQAPISTTIKPYGIFVKLEQKHILLAQQSTPYFLKLLLVIVTGDMAGLLEQAKQFVSDTVASMAKPEATLTDVDLKGVALDSVTYNAKVNVSNPYSTPIPIGEIRYVLKSSGSVIATGTIPDPGSLKGSGDTLLDVEIKVPHSVLLSLVKDIAVDWDIDYELQVNLVVDLPLIGDISIPVSSTGEIKLPSLTDFFT
ncbi:hypothetical protein L1987_28645 [Smallanthus sonchifolius]|uniref:Uncharacterized protein n=1 Tax=Smallanthus sonchifolius TaxID=185202 RepID=A0ACB9HXT7_9ASTR|nr:hypothetical protein L1987_28645 [Smallanthus sonchifolius]